MKKITKDDIRNFLMSDAGVGCLDSVGYHDHAPMCFFLHLDKDGNFLDSYFNSVYNFYSISPYLTSLNKDDFATLDWDSYFDSDDFKDIVDDLFDVVKSVA